MTLADDARSAPEALGRALAAGSAGDAQASSVPASVRLWAALVAAGVTLDRAIERDAARCRVVGPDVLSVLLPLAQAPGHRLRLGDLAERTGLTPSGLTRRIDTLVQDGLVSRVGCPQDRRGTYAALTKDGLEALPDALAHHAGVLDRSLAGRLDPAAVERLTVLLEELSGADAERWWGAVPDRVHEPEPEARIAPASSPS